MCYYISVDTLKKKEIELKGKSKKLPEMSKLVQNGFDYGSTPIIKSKADDWEFEMAHWELIAPWINNMAELEESRKKFTTLNATAEKLLESKLFHEPTLKRRCIIPATGFYEWRTYKGKKYPYFITPSTSEEDGFFLMAGIYNTWTDKSSGETIDAFAIITTRANTLMEEIHNAKKRMPLLFNKQLANEWLSDIGEDEIKAATAFEYDSQKMKAYTIAKEFRNSIEPREAHTYPELPEVEA
ncbi:MAG: SOS response-associated peptidase [bacterium]